MVLVGYSAAAKPLDDSTLYNLFKQNAPMARFLCNWQSVTVTTHQLMQSPNRMGRDCHMLKITILFGDSRSEQIRTHNFRGRIANQTECVADFLQPQIAINL